MDFFMLDAAGQALLLILEPHRLAFLSLGVIIGLVLGIIPGIGGLTGLALLLPFTFTMDAYTAFAFLLGLSAVTSISDTIPAVLFGVPGTTASQATVLDGLPMAKKGEAGRALSAAYTASLMGGLFGAVLLAITLPILRPVAMHIGSPELFAFSIFGISMVAVLSGNAPLRGLGIAAFGIMLAMVGVDIQTATTRWTQGTMYLWDGLPLVPLTLGLFALPELCDLAVKRTAIAAKGAKYDVRAGMLDGARDTFRNWWLVVRCSWLGAGIGALPGIGSSILDWLAYGHALRSEKGASKTFGKGDVRGVIAPEAANNAKEAGALVPTLAFGVPGGAATAILLGAFLIHGLVPGPDMLSVNLNVTYSMVWSIAIANIIGAGLCFMLSGQFAKLATLRYTLIIPAIITVTLIGAYSASGHWGDLITLLAFGVIGWTMKQLKWPRPPLILGFVLGAIIERYMFISIGRYGFEWLMRPLVVILLAMALLSLCRSFLQDVRGQGGLRKMLGTFGRPAIRGTDIFAVLLIIVFAVMIYQASAWPAAARLAPLMVGWFGLAIVTVSLGVEIFRRNLPVAADGEEIGEHQKIYMDLSTDADDLTQRQIVGRGLEFLGWVLGFLVSMALIGFIPTIPIFVLGYMWVNNREKLTVMIPMAVCLTAFVYFVFDRVLSIMWPDTVLGSWFPALRFIPSV